MKRRTARVAIELADLPQPAGGSNVPARRSPCYRVVMGSGRPDQARPRLTHEDARLEVRCWTSIALSAGFCIRRASYLLDEPPKGTIPHASLVVSPASTAAQASVVVSYAPSLERPGASPCTCSTRRAAARPAPGRRRSGVALDGLPRGGQAALIGAGRPLSSTGGERMDVPKCTPCSISRCLAGDSGLRSSRSGAIPRRRRCRS